MRTALTVLEWILAVFLAIGFLFAGGVKLLSRPAMIQEFAQIGIGQWFRYLTGVLEVAGAIGVLIPRFRLWGSLILAAVMAGATYVNLAVLHVPPLARLTVFLLAASLLLAWLARTRARV